jgi:hypothetical protein
MADRACEKTNVIRDPTSSRRYHPRSDCSPLRKRSRLNATMPSIALNSPMLLEERAGETPLN